jgi:hypothetical protein
MRWAYCWATLDTAATLTEGRADAAALKAARGITLAIEAILQQFVYNTRESRGIVGDEDAGRINLK